MNKYLFSYQNYIHLLNLIKEQNTLCDYKDIIMSSKGGGILLFYVMILNFLLNVH